jgi:hypothetical protein
MSFLSLAMLSMGRSRLEAALKQADVSVAGSAPPTILSLDLV